jgi:hypothetical protein
MTVADPAGLTPNPYPDEEKALNAALAKAQGEFPAIAKSKTATVRMKAGGTYTYTYADLADILAAVRPVLAKHGLALIQRLENSGGQPSIRTELRHTEGAVIAASFPIGSTNGTPQELGSLLTYLRRYALTAMLGIAAEDDNDAQDVASAPAADPQVAEASPFQPPDVKQEPLVEDLTSAQRKTIYAIKTKLTGAGLFDDEQFKAALVKAYGVDSVSGLDKGQASELIGRLKIQEDALDKETA